MKVYQPGFFIRLHATPIQVVHVCGRKDLPLNFKGSKASLLPLSPGLLYISSGAGLLTP